MGLRGPKPVSSEELYSVAEEFYRDFKALLEGRKETIFDRDIYEQLTQSLRTGSNLNEAEQREFNHREQEIRSARLAEAEKEKRLDRLQRKFQGRWIDREFGNAFDQARRTARTPGQPIVARSLLRATSPEQVRQICKKAVATERIPIEDPEQGAPAIVGFVEAETLMWPIPYNSRLFTSLYRHPEEFIHAKNDPRFPRSDRPSNQLKQIWFLSRALAGALHGLAPRTAIELVGSKRPEQIIRDSRAGKATRKRADQG
jgi:hypothetical protein